MTVFENLKAILYLNMIGEGRDEKNWDGLLSTTGMVRAL